MSLEVLWICTIELFVHEIALSALRPLRRAWTGEEILAKLPENNPITVQPILPLVITLSFTIPYLPNHTMYKLTWIEPNWIYSIVSISFVSFFSLFSTCLPYLLRNRPVPSSISLLHTSNQPTNHSSSKPSIQTPLSDLHNLSRPDQTFAFIVLLLPRVPSDIRSATQIPLSLTDLFFGPHLIVKEKFHTNELDYYGTYVRR